MREAHVAERALDPRAVAGPVAQPEPDVLGHGEVGEQRVVLKHQPDTALLRRKLSRVSALGHRRAVDRDTAGLQGLEAGREPQQRGLAASRRPEQAYELAGLDADADVIDRDRRAEAMGDVGEFESAHRGFEGCATARRRRQVEAGFRWPGRERVIVRLIRMTGTTPAATMVKAPSAHSSSSSSDAYWYTKVARVSKLNGRRIRVSGSSFIVSTNTSSAAVMRLGRMIGRCTRTSERAGPAPQRPRRAFDARGDAAQTGIHGPIAEGEEPHHVAEDQRDRGAADQQPQRHAEQRAACRIESVVEVSEGHHDADREHRAGHRVADGRELGEPAHRPPRREADPIGEGDAGEGHDDGRPGREHHAVADEAEVIRFEGLGVEPHCVTAQDPRRKDESERDRRRAPDQRGGPAHRRERILGQGLHAGGGLVIPA